MESKVLKPLSMILACLVLVLALPPQARAEEAVVIEVATMEDFLAALEALPLTKTILLTQDIEASVYADTFLPVPDGFSPSSAVATIRGNVHIDLQGHTIKAHLRIMDRFVDFLAVEADGNLSLRNGTILATGMSQDRVDIASPVSNRGTCRLAQINLTGGFGLYAYPTATTIIESGHFIGTSYYGFENYGSATLYNGAFEGGEGGFFQGMNPLARTIIHQGEFHGGSHSMASQAGALPELLAPGSRALDLDSYAPLTWENPFETLAPVLVRSEAGDPVVGYQIDTGPYAYSILQGSGAPVPVGDRVEIRLDHFPAGYLPDRVYANQVDISGSRDEVNHYSFPMPPEDVRITVTLKDATLGNKVRYFAIGEKTFGLEENGVFSSVAMDVAPYVTPDTHRTMLPIRFVGQALGLDVAYDDASKDITLTGPDHKVVLNLDRTQGTINHVPFVLETKPEVFQGRTMLPVAEIAALLGLDRYREDHPQGFLYWYGDQEIVMISTPSV